MVSILDILLHSSSTKIFLSKSTRYTEQNTHAPKTEPRTLIGCMNILFGASFSFTQKVYILFGNQKCDQMFRMVYYIGYKSLFRIG